jgi:hypothetical protein
MFDQPCANDMLPKAVFAILDSQPTLARGIPSPRSPVFAAFAENRDLARVRPRRQDAPL